MARNLLPRENHLWGPGHGLSVSGGASVCVSPFLPWSHFLFPWPHTLQAEAPRPLVPEGTMCELSSPSALEGITGGFFCSPMWSLFLSLHHESPWGERSDGHVCLSLCASQLFC